MLLDQLNQPKVVKMDDTGQKEIEKDLKWTLWILRSTKKKN